MTIFKAEKRDITKKEQTSMKDAIPAVIYGKDFKNIHVNIAKADFIKGLREAGESAVFSLDLEGKDYDVLIQDIQQHTVTGKVLHVDFLVVKKGQTIEVDVPLEFVGESPATKNGVGALTKLMHEIEVETTPGKLPKNIEVDISVLKELHDSITVADLKIIEGVTFKAEPTATIAMISAQREEEEEEIPEEPDFDSIEVEQKGKKSEEGEGGQEEQSKKTKPEEQKEDRGEE